jgi:hypothetical protein
MYFKESYDGFHGMRARKVNTSLPFFFLTGAQIRAARSLIRWTAEDLAAASALSVCHHSPRGAKGEPDGTDERQ